jgi:glycosyltransferase involved in cell wall biosynthesis
MNCSIKASSFKIYKNGKVKKQKLFKRKIFPRYSDPGKIKAYLAAGLPVVITNVPKIAEVIERAKCGIAIPDEKEALVNAVSGLLANEEMLKQYRKNAINFIGNYT